MIYLYTDIMNILLFHRRWLVTLVDIMDVDSLRSTLKTHGHEHLLQFWDKLSAEEQQQLYADLSSIDYAKINQYFSHCSDALKRAEAGEKVDDQIQPLPPQTFGSVSKTSPELIQKYESEGNVRDVYDVPWFLWAFTMFSMYVYCVCVIYLKLTYCNI